MRNEEWLWETLNHCNGQVSNIQWIYVQDLQKFISTVMLEKKLCKDTVMKKTVNQTWVGETLFCYFGYKAYQMFKVLTHNGLLKLFSVADSHFFFFFFVLLSSKSETKVLFTHTQHSWKFSYLIQMSCGWTSKFFTQTWQFFPFSKFSGSSWASRPWVQQKKCPRPRFCTDVRALGIVFVFGYKNCNQKLKF